MNLLLVDDHALFREGLCALLAGISPGVNLREAACVKGAIAECTATRFQMVLLDLGLDTTDGLGTLEAFRAAVPEVPVIVLSSEENPRYIKGAIDLGAVGFIPKAHTSKLMIAALRFVLAGGIYLPQALGALRRHCEGPRVGDIASRRRQKPGRGGHHRGQERHSGRAHMRRSISTSGREFLPRVKRRSEYP
jgi:DNA-binding NarL/FixJ family response regulator